MLMAMARALVAKSAPARESMAQPTTGRENVSSTTQQSSLPYRVGSSVTPDTHSWLGPVRVNLHLTKSVTATPGEVRLPRRRWSGEPVRPARRISNPTLLFPIRNPGPRTSSACIRSLP